MEDRETERLGDGRQDGVKGDRQTRNRRQGDRREGGR